MSSWIFGFFEGRKNAITAWKLDGYIPWDEVEKEYGLSVKDLFNAGLLVKRGRYWRDLPFYPYLLSDLGRPLHHFILKNRDKKVDLDECIDSQNVVYNSE